MEDYWGHPKEAKIKQVTKQEDHAPRKNCASCSELSRTKYL